LANIDQHTSKAAYV